MRTRLPYAMTYSLSSIVCVRTAPRPVALAFVWKQNGILKSGHVRVGAAIKAFFKSWNAFSCSFPHSQRRFVRNSRVNGSVLEAQSEINLRYHDTVPKYLRSCLMVLGAGYSLIPWTLSGSTWSPCSFTIYPGYRTLEQQKWLFS